MSVTQAVTNHAVSSDRVQAPVADARLLESESHRSHGSGRGERTLAEDPTSALVGNLASAAMDNISGELGNGNPHKIPEGDLEGGDQRSASPKDAAKEKNIPNIWEEHEKLIDGLVKHLAQKMPDGKIRRTVTSDTRKLVADIQKSFKRIRELTLATPKSIISKRRNTTRVAKSQKFNPTPAVIDQKKKDGDSTPAKVKQLSDARRELFLTPGTEWKTPFENTAKKRKSDERTPPSEDETKAPKKASQDKSPQAEAHLTAEKMQKQEETLPQSSSAEEMEWEQTKKKKTKKKRAMDGKGANPPKNPPKQRRKKMLPKAILVSATSGASYADMLKKVKVGLNEEELGGSIDTIRRTNSDKLLIVLNRKDGDKMAALQSKVAVVMGTEAEVIGKSHEVELSIKNLDEITTADEVKAALQKAAGSEIQIEASCIRALRPAYKGTQIASVKLPEEVARKVMGERGKIRIGLANCPIKEINRLQKCYKCWNTGHIAGKCKSQIDRSSNCLKCGQAGHKIAQCMNDPHCPLCAEREKDHRHMVGSYKCAVFHEKKEREPGSRK